MLKNCTKVIVSLLIVLMIVTVATKALAANNLDDLLNDLNTGNNGNIDGNNAQTIPEGENKTENTPENLNTTPTTGNNAAANAPEKTPYTGIGDYSSLVFIAIFAVSAIYAYKKIRDYNVK